MLAFSANDQRNNEAPPPCSLVNHSPKSTTRQLTRTDRKPDAAGFGRTQLSKAIIKV
jgi:hypothetical protein